LPPKIADCFRKTSASWAPLFAKRPKCHQNHRSASKGWRGGGASEALPRQCAGQNAPRGGARGMAASKDSNSLFPRGPDKLKVNQPLGCQALPASQNYGAAAHPAGNGRANFLIGSYREVGVAKAAGAKGPWADGAFKAGDRRSGLSVRANAGAGQNSSGPGGLMEGGVWRRRASRLGLRRWRQLGLSVDD
jgi:hypothetical protein